MPTGELVAHRGTYLARKLVMNGLDLSARGVSVTIAALVLVAGCAGREQPPAQSAAGETQTTAGSTSAGATDIVVAEDLRRACDLSDMPAEAPRFDFDSARLRPRGEDILANVAACVASGRLGDSTLEVVGHTDPRGPADYNAELGLYRAVAAKQSLVARGVPDALVDVRSRGEVDARGSDDISWARDRRVEIHLVRRGAPR